MLPSKCICWPWKFPSEIGWEWEKEKSTDLTPELFTIAKLKTKWVKGLPSSDYSITFSLSLCEKGVLKEITQFMYDTQKGKKKRDDLKSFEKIRRKMRWEWGVSTSTGGLTDSSWTVKTHPQIPLMMIGIHFSSSPDDMRCVVLRWATWCWDSSLGYHTPSLYLRHDFWITTCWHQMLKIVVRIVTLP